MTTNVGFSALLLALAVALYGLGAVVYGRWKDKLVWVESARTALFIVFPLLTISIFSLVNLLLNGFYEVAYVYTLTSNSMPETLRFTALWAGQAGALLLWTWLVSGTAALIALRKWDRLRDYEAAVVGIFLTLLVFSISLILLDQNPFVRFWQMPEDVLQRAMFGPENSTLVIPLNGKGEHPLLRSTWMILYPPMLLTGFAVFTVPFAFGMAALLEGRIDTRWFSTSIRWIRSGWLLLTLSMLMASRLMYDVGGGGQLWKWGQIEMAAFLPWLSSTAFLHLIQIQQKRDLIKRWNLIMGLLTFIFSLYGIYLMQVGLFTDVNALRQEKLIPFLLGFSGAVTVLFLFLLFLRRRDLRSREQLLSMLSRESMFMYLNIVVLMLIVTVVIGQVYPLLARWIAGQDVVVGADYYARTAPPLFALILILGTLGILSGWHYVNPRRYGRDVLRMLLVSFAIVGVLYLNGVEKFLTLLSFWVVIFVMVSIVYEYGRAVLLRRRRFGESLIVAFLRQTRNNRTRYGAYFIQLGLVLILMVFIGIQEFQMETQGTLKVGDSMRFNEFTLTYTDLDVVEAPNGRTVARVVLSVAENGVPRGDIYPRREFYYDTQRSVTQPEIYSNLRGDLYVTLVDWMPITPQYAVVWAYFNPMVGWLWIGGAILVLGTLLMVLPSIRPEPEYRDRPDQQMDNQ